MPPSDSTDLLFSKKRYEKRRGEIRLHMSHFFLRYLNDIYEAFRGDLALAIVLGEISHHNTTELFSPHREANDTLRAIQNDPALFEGMTGCNAYSMSCATGIPRETVRRKITELKRRGWVEEAPKEGLRITKACTDHFGPDYSLRFLNGLLRASRKIESLLGEEDDASNPKPKPTRSVGRRKPSVPKPTRQTKTRTKSVTNKT